MISKISFNKKRLFIELKNISWLIMICSLASVISYFLNNVGIGKENTLMIFLVGVMIVTIVTNGFIYGILAFLICFLTFNFLFTEPKYSLKINDMQDLVLMIFFLLASVITELITTKLQRQKEIAKKNEFTTKILYNISASYLDITELESAVMCSLNLIFEHTGYKAIAYLQINNKSNKYKKNNPEGRVIACIPLNGLSGELGKLDVYGEQKIGKDKLLIIDTIAYNMTLVLDRILINNEREEIKLVMEKEHLKSNLLRSVSHDIRTPLTGIMGASSLIADSYESLAASEIKQLAVNINEESNWLIKTVQNILDLTRMSEGAFGLKKRYETVDDLVEEALTHIKSFITMDILRVILPEEIVLFNVDGRLIVQMLINLLDNAYKHSGADDIVLKVCKVNDKVVFEICDNGCGVDANIRKTVFDEFVTMPKKTSDASRGIGLGLSICKTIAKAHGGDIMYIEKEKGACFEVTIPVEDNENV